MKLRNAFQELANELQRYNKEGLFTLEQSASVHNSLAELRNFVIGIIKREEELAQAKAKEEQEEQEAPELSKVPSDDDK